MKGKQHKAHILNNGIPYSFVKLYMLIYAVEHINDKQQFINNNLNLVNKLDLN